MIRMLRRFSFLSWVALAIATLLISVAASFAQPGGPGGPGGPPPGDGPPQEAIAACQGKQQGNACSISTPQGNIVGTCGVLEQQLVCMPQGGPPGGPGEGPPGNR